MTWILFITIAMAPDFVMHSQRIEYLTEKDCRRALDKYMDRVAEDGLVIIGRCARKDGKK